MKKLRDYHDESEAARKKLAAEDVRKFWHQIGDELVYIPGNFSEEPVKYTGHAVMQ